MIQIALDGPSGAGKSTLAKMLAAELSFVYVDTGALYRAVGLYASEKGLEKTDTAGIIAILPEIRLTLRYVDGSQRVILGDRDVSEDIRLPEISMWASTVSAIPEVRAFLLDLQKDIAEKNNVIMDGRDIGTVILPNATVKIFLDSSSEARAKRRYRELCEKGIETSYDEVLADMIRRDENDRNRATAPLKKANDAVLLDNSDLNLKESYEAALRIIREKIG